MHIENMKYYYVEKEDKDACILLRADLERIMRSMASHMPACTNKCQNKLKHVPICMEACLYFEMWCFFIRRVKWKVNGAKRNICQHTRVLETRLSTTFFCWSNWPFKALALSCKTEQNGYLYGGATSLVLHYANVVLNIICPFTFRFRRIGT